MQNCQTAVEEAENTAEILIRFGEIAGNYHDSEVQTEEELPIPDVLLEGIISYNWVLETLSSESSHDFQGDSLEFIQDLFQQEMLSYACRVIIAYFTAKQSVPINYANTVSSDLRHILEELVDTENPDEFEIHELAALYRRCGVYFETALPPMVALVYGLESEAKELEEIREMKLSNAISKVRSFPPLRAFVREFDSNIRNAVDHGCDSGYYPDPRREVIEFRYEIAGNIVSEEKTFSEFRKSTLESCYAAIGLFGMPIFILLMYPHLLILDEYGELEVDSLNDRN